MTQLLSGATDIVIVGAATTVGEGIAMFERHRPGIVIIDLDLLASKDIIRRFRGVDAESILILLATYTLDSIATEALAMGATAVIGKDQISLDLLDLINRFQSVPPP